MEKITIVKIGRKQQPSKFKPGETYSITTLLDEKGRKLAAMGQWAEAWKIGDVIEADIEEKKWTDKDGFEQVSLNLKNPNQKQFIPRGGPSPLVTAYELAASLAPLLYANKKKVTLKDIDELATEIKKKIEFQSAIPAIDAKPEKKEEVKEVDVEEDTEVADDEDDSDKPF